MNFVDRLFNRVDRIKASPAARFMSATILVAFFIVVVSTSIFLMNFLFFEIDLRPLFFPIYESLGFPTFQRSVGVKIELPFFRYFEVGARPILVFQPALFVLLALLLFAANIRDGWQKALQILLFFLFWGCAGVKLPYLRDVFMGFYNGSIVRAAMEFTIACILYPFLLLTFSFAFIIRNELVIRR
jgi:hypothetical protein